MNSTLSKLLKTFAVFVLCMCIAFSCTACAKVPKNINETDQICVSGALYESWMYVLTDKEFVTEMVTLLDEIEFEKSDEAVDMMTAGEIISFSFSKGNETITNFIVDKNGRFCFEAGEQAYVITSDFDFEHVKSLVDEQIEAFNANLHCSTKDEA